MEHVEIVMERTTLEDLPPGSPNASFAIREYQPGDEIAWTRIQTEADRYNAITPELFFQAFGRDSSQHMRRVLFAVRSQDLIGTSAAWWGSSPEDKWGRVHWVAVLPEWQRRGIGRSLLIATLGRLREAGYTRAFLTTSAVRLEALRLYLSVGFVPRLDGPNDRIIWSNIATSLGGDTLESRLSGSEGAVE